MSDNARLALLRPAVEAYSAMTALICGLIALIAPWALMMPPTWAS